MRYKAMSLTLEPRMPCRHPLLAAIALSCSACQPAPPTPAALPHASQPARVPLQTVLDTARAENKRMENIHDSAYGTGILLGQLNGKLQSHAYFRRIPNDRALEGVESQLRQLAVDKGLTVSRLEKHVDPAPPQTAAVTLKPGERWQPTLDQLRGVVQLSVDIQGGAKDIVGYIDALPQAVERLVVVNGASAVPGGVRLMAEAYFERELPAPQIDIRWPTLEDRLDAAGWDAKDAKLLADPVYAELKKEVDLGRVRLPDVRRTLQISADFPRWLLRARFFEEKANAALAVRGQAILATGAPGVQ
jgi:hypothetical protein